MFVLFRCARRVKWFSFPLNATPSYRNTTTRQRRSRRNAIIVPNDDVSRRNNLRERGGVIFLNFFFVRVSRSRRPKAHSETAPETNRVESGRVVARIERTEIKQYEARDVAIRIYSSKVETLETYVRRPLPVEFGGCSQNRRRGLGGV